MVIACSVSAGGKGSPFKCTCPSLLREGTRGLFSPSEDGAFSKISPRAGRMTQGFPISGLRKVFFSLSFRHLGSEGFVETHPLPTEAAVVSTKNHSLFAAGEENRSKFHLITLPTSAYRTARKQNGDCKAEDVSLCHCAAGAVPKSVRGGTCLPHTWSL